MNSPPTRRFVVGRCDHEPPRLKRDRLGIFSSLLLGGGVFFAGEICAQAPAQLLPRPNEALRVIGSVGDGEVFFFEDGNDPDTGQPMPPPSVPLAPITTAQTIDVETGSVVLRRGTVRSFLQVDVYLRQRDFYRNDGQNQFRVHSNPFIQLESPVFNGLNDPSTGEPLNGVWKFSVLGNGLHLAAAKTLEGGESGNDSRGNFGRVIITRTELDQLFGNGTGAMVFSRDLTLRVSVISTVRGLHQFVVGTLSEPAMETRRTR